jgi:hypothetical protein
MRLPSLAGAVRQRRRVRLQAAHCQRSERNNVPGQGGIGWCGPAAAELVGVAVRLSGLNCIH